MRKILQVFALCAINAMNVSCTAAGRQRLRCASGRVLCVYVVPMYPQEKKEQRKESDLERMKRILAEEDGEK